jgi:dihydroorotase
VNISAVGLVAETGEAGRSGLCDADLCAETVEKNRDVVVGVKVRLDHRAAGNLGTLPLLRAVEAAAMAGVPVMVHIASGPPGIEEVLEILRSGDIVTHCTTGQDMRLVDQGGALLTGARKAHERGVIFDMGHGVGGFSFTVAQSMINAGVPPDTISSDAHQLSLLGPMFDLPTCMSKGLTMGMALNDVIGRATNKPAHVVGLDGIVGRIAVGRRADVAVFSLEAGLENYYDTDFNMRTGTQRLVNRCTVSAGTPLPAVKTSRCAPWVRLSDGQRRIRGERSAEAS